MYIYTYILYIYIYIVIIPFSIIPFFAITVSLTDYLHWLLLRMSYPILYPFSHILS